jgi:hypothetical protein
MLRCHDYVNHGYTQVCDALLANPSYVFRAATAAAATQAASLHARIAGLDIGKDVAIDVTEITRDTGADNPVTRLTLEWSALGNPGIFPSMLATLSVIPMTATETQLELEGHYFAPLGKLGEAIDAVLGHRIAEECVARFVQEVAGWLRETLVTASPPPATTLAERIALDAEC